MAGLPLALRAARHGRVAFAEREKLGGTCLNRGCIPAKTMIASAAVGRQDLAAVARARATGSTLGSSSSSWTAPRTGSSAATLPAPMPATAGQLGEVERDGRVVGDPMQQQP